VDLSKLVRGYKELLGDGLITRDRASRELTGMKFSKVAKRLRIENEQLITALAPLAPLLSNPEPVNAPELDPTDDEPAAAAVVRLPGVVGTRNS
jgi:hypothetical protein